MSKKLIEWMERMKEVQRMQYDYFKFLITLSTGSILIIIAILEKVLTDPQILVKVLIMISIVGFAATIIFSLGALPNTGNIILYINALQKPEIEKDEKKKREFGDKIDKAFKDISISGRIVFYSYASGIVVLLISVGVYFFD
jgi:hypothetical protein